MQATVPENRGARPSRRGGDSRIFCEVPRDAGPRLSTPRGGAMHVVRPPGSQRVDRADANLVSIMLAPAPGLRSAIGSDRLQEYHAPTGAIVITPAGADAQVSWTRTRENSTIVLPPESLLELAGQELDAGGVALRPPPFGMVDPWALQIARLLKTELTQRQAPNELYVDSLVTVFAVHLLRNYSDAHRPLPQVMGGLSAGQARRVRDYLEANFARKLTVGELAAVAGLSPYYFIQAFARTFGKPPHRYIVDLRLDFAEKLLAIGELSIADVAYVSGFSSQSHLTATMSKQRNVTPRQIQRQD